MNLKKDSKKFVLVDVHALVHRAYHAFPAHLSVNGKQTNAVYGFTSLLIEVIKKFDPSYIVCCVDAGKPTKRLEIFKDYKATRKPTEQELLDQLPMVHEIIHAFEIKIFGKDGYEADDLIGTIVTQFNDFKVKNGNGTLRQAQGDNLETIIVTGDKDIFQLVDKDTFVYLAGGSFSKSKLYDAEGVEEKMGFGPEKVIDYKALRGDPSDNIPGVAGIGDKGAKELLAQFGDLDSIIKNLESIENKRVKTALAKGVEQAKLSEQLATIDTKMDIDFDLDSCKFEGLGNGKLLETFKKYKFFSLLKKLDLPQEENQMGMFASQQTAGSKQRAAISTTKQDKLNSGVNYRILDEKGLRDFLKELKDQDKFAFDTETSSLDAISADLLGISISFKEKEAVYIPAELLKTQNRNPQGGNFQNLKSIFEDPKVLKIGHNIKYDMQILKGFGIETKGEIFDTMLAAYVLKMGQGRVGLKVLAFEKFGMQMKEFKELEKLATMKGHFETIPVEKLGPYACADADATWRLYCNFKFDPSTSSGLNKRKLRKVFEEIEMPFVRILAQMEFNGIKLDIPFLEKFTEKLDSDLEDLRKKIYDLAGLQFNINSPKQVGQVLFDKLGLTTVKKTRTGEYSTDERTLRDLRSQHEIIDFILDYRELAKLRSTYTHKLIAQVNKKTGRIHTTFNQAIASTGRLTSSSPNLQNIPVATEIGNKIRQAFVPENGKIFVSLDYSQQELRILAGVSKDKELIKAYKNNVDVHALTASKLFGVDIDKVTKNQRSQGKTVNFSVIYGISSYGLSDRLKIDRDLAQEFIDTYFLTYPGVRAYFDGLLDGAKTKGFVETAYGRRRDASDLISSNFRIRNASEREIINFPIQGGAADMMKKAMILVDKALSDKKSFSKAQDKWDDYKMVLQVHDELLFEVPRKQIPNNKSQNTNFVEIVKDAMLEANIYDVPMKVDVGVGKRWGEIEEIDL